MWPLEPVLAVVAFGACLVERPLALERATRGRHRAASVEPGGARRPVDPTRVTEAAPGDGVNGIAARRRSSLEERGWIDG